MLLRLAFMANAVSQSYPCLRAQHGPVTATLGVTHSMYLTVFLLMGHSAFLFLYYK